jgi:putative membrane protein
MTRQLLSAAAALAFLASAAVAQMGAPPADEFVTMASSSDMFEIQSSTAALEKTESAEVKGFAEMMVADHTKSSEELLAAVEASALDIEPPGAMTPEHQERFDALNGENVTDFDAAYIDVQVLAHQEALALMQSYAETGDNEALRAHAQKSVPIIQAHFERAQELDKTP